jgi:hypothetical protein
LFYPIRIVFEVIEPLIKQIDIKLGVHCTIHTTLCHFEWLLQTFQNMFCIRCSLLNEMNQFYGPKWSIHHIKDERDFRRDCTVLFGLTQNRWEHIAIALDWSGLRNNLAEYCAVFLIKSPYCCSDKLNSKKNFNHSFHFSEREDAIGPLTQLKSSDNHANTIVLFFGISNFVFIYNPCLNAISNHIQSDWMNEWMNECISFVLFHYFSILSHTLEKKSFVISPMLHWSASRAVCMLKFKARTAGLRRVLKTITTDSSLVPTRIQHEQSNEWINELLCV